MVLTLFVFIATSYLPLGTIMALRKPDVDNPDGWWHIKDLNNVDPNLDVSTLDVQSTVGCWKTHERDGELKTLQFNKWPFDVTIPRKKYLR